MKKNLKLIPAIFLILFSSCQEEEFTTKTPSNKISVKEIPYDNAKKIKVLDNALTEVFDGIKKHKTINKNTAPVEDNDFTIDKSTDVKVMSDGNSTTYTMLIKRVVENPNFFENLVVQIDSENQPKAYIFKYIPAEASKYISTHSEFSFKGSFEVREIAYNASVFNSLVNLGGCGKVALCDYGGCTHIAGDNCSDVYFVLGNCDTNTPDGGGGGYIPYTAPVVSGGSAPLQGNLLKMNAFITNMSFPKQDVFNSLPKTTADAIFNYFVANNFSSGSTSKVSTFLQSIINNHLESYFIGDLSATTIDPNIETSTNNIFNYLIQNNFSSQSVNFALWAFKYLSQNPNVSAQQFKNWFLTPREGKDGDYDANFWENPNITFPQQTLPTFQAFDDAYPREDGTTLIQLIGGDVQNKYDNNPNDVRGFCALKVSRGLNGSGILIPNLPGKTVKGGDNKYYFLNAKALNKWMRMTFGTNDGDPKTPHNPNHIHLTAAQGGLNGINFPALTANIKGIFSMVTDDPNHDWASGHADLINNSNCVFGCHFHDVPDSILDYIDIWILN